MVSCPSGLFIMYVCPMLPLYADSQPAWTRPSATPTEAPKPSRETAPCIKSHPRYRSAAVAWRRQLGAPQCAQIAPRKPRLPVIIGLQPHIGAHLGGDLVKPSPAPPCVSINPAWSTAPASPAASLTLSIAGPLPAHHQQHSPPMLSPHHSQHHLQPSHSH